jgi:hypothetical protein
LSKRRVVRRPPGGAPHPHPRQNPHHPRPCPQRPRKSENPHPLTLLKCRLQDPNDLSDDVLAAYVNAVRGDNSKYPPPPPCFKDEGTCGRLRSITSAFPNPPSPSSSTAPATCATTSAATPSSSLLLKLNQNPSPLRSAPPSSAAASTTGGGGYDFYI